MREESLHLKGVLQLRKEVLAIRVSPVEISELIHNMRDHHGEGYKG